MKVDTVIGIDPGSIGGITIFQPGKPIKAVKIPKETTDLSTLLLSITEDRNPLVFVEKVQMRHDDMTGGKAFRIKIMLEGYDRLKNVLEINRIPFVLVHPMTWQSRLKLRVKGEEKEIRKRRYKTVAQGLYSEIRATLWNCDATLIMHFGRYMIQNDKKWIRSNLPKEEQPRLL